MNHRTRLLAPFLLLLLTAPSAWPQAGSVLAEQEISATEGGFGGMLDPSAPFGSQVAALGDLDGDGFVDLAVGVPGDDDGGIAFGAVWILFLAGDGTVRAEQKISALEGGFGGEWHPGDHFGDGVAALGDRDGDGTVELAVGAIGDDDGGGELGAVWILSLAPDGTVSSEQKISQTSGGFGGTLVFGDSFGGSLAAVGDVDGDGIDDLAVGAPFTHGIDEREGALWILFLNDDGTVKGEQKIGEGIGGFGSLLHWENSFTWSLAALGDLDGDAVPDLAAGAPYDSTGGLYKGAVWILFLNADGTVKDQQKISQVAGGFGGALDPLDGFGTGVAALPDLDGDGVVELVVGAWQDDDGGINKGAVWILHLDTDGRVKDEQKISETSGGFGGQLDRGDYFGYSVATLGDLDHDGGADLAVGAPAFRYGEPYRGAVWILFLEPPPCMTLDFETEDDRVTPLVNGQHIDTEFGRLVTLSSSGANAGLAVFDSTVGGPNDPSQDPDLLVGSGNVLILQTENFPPDANDVFPRPNDDEDGGTMTFTFTRALALDSVRLIDIDASDGTSSLVLTDEASNQRTYIVPPNWTGDALLGQPGHGVLDLTMLASQPGFGSTATAAEDPGFDPRHVVRLDLHLDGSGALDDLIGSCSDAPRASVTVRNGSLGNPTLLTSTTLPVIGTSWSAELDCSPSESGLAVIVARSRPTSGTRTPFGELLVAGEVFFQVWLTSSDAPSHAAWNIPRDPALLGFEVHVQGLCRAAATSRGKIRLDRGRLSNALDLVIGY